MRSFSPGSGRTPTLRPAGGHYRQTVNYNRTHTEWVEGAPRSGVRLAGPGGQGRDELPERRRLQDARLGRVVKHPARDLRQPLHLHLEHDLPAGTFLEPLRRMPLLLADRPGRRAAELDPHRLGLALGVHPESPQEVLLRIEVARPLEGIPGQPEARDPVDPERPDVLPELAVPDRVQLAPRP